MKDYEETKMILSQWSSLFLTRMPEFIVSLNTAIEALEQTHWIPVSERLPEEDTYVLVTTKWKDGSTEIGIDRIVNGKWILSILDEGDTVTSWMPLPKPYKEESEE